MNSKFKIHIYQIYKSANDKIKYCSKGCYLIKINIKIKIIYIVKGICFSNFLSNVPTR